VPGGAKHGCEAVIGRLTQLPSMTLAVLLALTVGQALVVGPEARAAGGGKLEGNWLMESTIVNCATGDPLPIPGNPFPSLYTYMRGGTVLDSGASPPSAPGGPRSSAHVIWECRALRSFASASTASVLMLRVCTSGPLKSHSNAVLYRENTLSRMKSLGLVPPSSLLPLAI
jgi:hypothetical protein